MTKTQQQALLSTIAFLLSKLPHPTQVQLVEAITRWSTKPNGPDFPTLNIQIAINETSRHLKG
jgi:hypothetical protein